MKNFYEVLVAPKIIVEKNNQILMVKRGHEPFKGTWDIPGGLLEDGESLEECALREVKEETDLDIELIGLIDAVHMKSNVEGYRDTILLYYRAEWVSGEAKADDDVDKVKWVNIEDILDIENLRPQFKEFLERNGI